MPSKERSSEIWQGEWLRTTTSDQCHLTPWWVVCACSYFLLRKNVLKYLCRLFAFAECECCSVFISPCPFSLSCLIYLFCVYLITKTLLFNFVFNFIFLSTSLCYQDGGPGDLFRGASYDRSFDGGSLFRSGSFERGMSFDSVGKSRGAGGGGGGSFDGGAGNESQLEESKQPLNASDLVLEKSRNPMGGTLTAAL